MLQHLQMRQAANDVQRSAVELQASNLLQSQKQLESQKVNLGINERVRFFD